MVQGRCAVSGGVAGWDGFRIERLRRKPFVSPLRVKNALRLG